MDDGDISLSPTTVFMLRDAYMCMWLYHYQTPNTLNQSCCHGKVQNIVIYSGNTNVSSFITCEVHTHTEQKALAEVGAQQVIPALVRYLGN
ncbi:predicted protein [Sclerotinia sclerotiorum 1980 UF-70]|uniref:Uncharacterized protein n=1 Tax=Sclerotinia sclerotiorum (strain ATCC 18683 / 1980 / Ss-1) TaxID=665079 RepID=A7ES64_SCLS1|nr:predicted protein [Sclerotinia sclerotiorum 1980 UF-70]EDN92306.1 predicted protein [Sclerotinia sclerotiorum 1980 UF-70]